METLISKEYYKKTIIKIIKAMKCDIYLITQNFIMGTNTENSYLSVVNTNVNMPTNMRFIEISKESLLEVDKILEAPNINNVTQLLIERSSIKSKFGFSDIYDMYMRTMNDISQFKCPSFIISNLKENLDFVNILGVKASDGALPLNLNESDTIYIYPGLLGINKSDMVQLNFYKFLQYNIAEFIIDKKFAKIHKYIKYLNF